MNWQLLAAQVLAGIANGGLYFLVASGLTLLWGALGIVNLAHGSFFMLAAFGAATCIQYWGTEYGFVAGCVLVPLLIGGFGAVLEFTLFRRVYHAAMWGQLLVSFGLVLVLNNLTRLIFGNNAMSMPPPAILARFIQIGGFRLARYQLLVLATTALVALFLWVLLNRSRVGRLIRAAVDDPDMLGAVGVDVGRLRTIVMAVAASLAGLAGAITVPRGAINAEMDVRIVLIAFAVVVVGGLGSVWGGLVAAMLIGMAETVSTLFLDQGGEVVIFAVMVMVLLIKPTGFRTIAGRE
jgi:branched-subunit amino acid ABC-type transport system permease component